VALDWSQLCILPARQSYIRQYGKMASGPEKEFSVLAFHETKSVSTKVQEESPKSTNNSCLVQAFCYQWPTRSPDVTTTMYFFLWSCVKDSVYVPLLPTTLHGLKTRIRQACANIDKKILHSVWQEVEYRFDVARATRGPHTELN
jgi:hypothetical protein